MRASKSATGSVIRQAVLVLPISIGAVIGKLSDDHLSSAVLLLAEPFLWILVAYLLLYLLFNGHNKLAAAFFLSGAAGLTLLHFPVGRPPQATLPTVPLDDTLIQIRECISQASVSQVSVRVVQWTLDLESEVHMDPEDLAKMQPDLVVLTGRSVPQFSTKIAEYLDGSQLEAKAQDRAGSIRLVIRGQLEDCAMGQTWWELGSKVKDAPSLVLALPRLAEAGLTPVLMVHVGMPENLRDLSSWHRRVRLAGEGIARITQALGSEKLIVLGDFAAPQSFKTLESRLTSVGLSEADLPASWPTEHPWGPLPGLHRLDRIWFGSSWINEDNSRWTISGQSRGLLRADLTPQTSYSDLEKRSELNL